MACVLMRKPFVVVSFTNLTYYCCVCVTKWHVFVMTTLVMSVYTCTSRRREFRLELLNAY